MLDTLYKKEWKRRCEQILSVVILCLIVFHFSPIRTNNVEASPDTTFRVEIIPGPQCYDGVDNDGDGLIDFPDDKGCDDASDNDETGSGIEPVTNITFLGIGYPNSEITLLKDGQIVKTVTTDENSKFEVAALDLSDGFYVFSMYARDYKDKRSMLYMVPVNVSKGGTIQVSDIILPPTVHVDKAEVKHGSRITFFGQSFPNADIDLTIFRGEDEIFTSDESYDDGIYTHNYETKDLEKLEYLVKAKAKTKDGQKQTDYSNTISFRVGEQNIEGEDTEFMKGDMNQDSKVNLVDFSVAAFWYGRSISNSFKIIEVRHGSGDRDIDLVDFSIIAYHWTG